MKEEHLKNIPLFAELTEEERRAIGKRMRVETYQANQALCLLGGDSDAFYLIKEGWVKLSSDNNVVVATLGNGSLVGDTDFFTHSHYTMSAHATNSVTVWALTTADIVEILDEHLRLGVKLSLAMGRCIRPYQEQLAEQLEDVRLLSNLSADELRLIAQRLIPRRLTPNETLYRDGESPQGIFFIEVGAIRILGDAEEDYAELSAGESFGDMAVLSNKLHTDTAQASTDAIVWGLSPQDFGAIVEQDSALKSKLSRNLSASLNSTDRTYAIKILRQIPLFADLSSAALDDVARLLLLRHIPAGEELFSQGAPGDAMYIVDTGAIDAVNQTPGHPAKLMARYGEGDYFGEAVLLTGKTRPFTATAIADTNLWGLYRTDFDNLLVKYPQLSAALSKVIREQFESTDDNSIELHLQKIATLGGLTRKQLDELSVMLKPRLYQANSAIYHEGSPANEMYFIESGSIEHRVNTMQGPMMLEIFSAGSFFGEIGLISGKGQPATAVSTAETELWVLSKADFESFVQRYPNLAMTFSRLLSERLDEVMNRMRGVAPQRGLPAPAPQPQQPHGSAHSQQTMGLMPVARPGVHSQQTMGLTPVARPAVHSQQTMGLTPVSRPPVHTQQTTGMAPVARSAAAHSQNTMGMAPVSGPTVHSQNTVGLAPTSRPQNTPPPRRTPAGTPPSPKPSRRQQKTTVAPTSQPKTPAPAPMLEAQAKPLSAPSPAISAPRQRSVTQPQIKSNRRLQREPNQPATDDNGFSMWFAQRTIGAKISFFLLIMLMTCVCGIALPFFVIEELSASFTNGGTIPGDDRPIVERMSEEGLIVGAVAAMPFVETRTPTITPSPTPTDTPTPTATFTSTPLPTSTDTPTPTSTPTETPTPIFTPTSTPTPTETSTPTRIPVYIPVEPTETPTPEPTATPNVDFRLVSVRELTPCENHGKHHIFVKVQDPSGQGINGVPVLIGWPGGGVTPKTEIKTNLQGQEEPGRLDFAMFKGMYSVEIAGATSQIAEGITPDYSTNQACGDDAVAISLFHTSYEVIFERTY